MNDDRLQEEPATGSRARRFDGPPALPEPASRKGGPMLQVAVQKRKLQSNPCQRVSRPGAEDGDDVPDLGAVGRLGRVPAGALPGLIYVAVDSGTRWSELIGLRRAKLVDIAWVADRLDGHCSARSTVGTGDAGAVHQVGTPPAIRPGRDRALDRRCT